MSDDLRWTAFPRPVRARLARLAAGLALGADVLALLASLAFPEAMDYPVAEMLLVLALPMALQAAIAFAPWHRLPPAWQELLLQIFVLSALGSVFGAVAARPAENGTGFAFIGFALGLSAVTLRLRDHAVAVALATVVGAAQLALIAPNPATGAFVLLPGILVGVIAGLWANVHGRMMGQAEDSRMAAEQASAALRAVVAGAHDAVEADPDTVIAAVVAATRHLGSRMSGLYVQTPDGMLEAAATFGVPEALMNAPVRPGGGLLGEVLRRRATVIVENYGSYARAVPLFVEAKLDATMGTPLRLPDGTILGVLVIGRFIDDAPFPNAAAQALELLADHAARALQLSREVDADRRTLRALERLTDQQRDFVATASHELRTPVTVIDGIATTLHHHRDVLPEDQQRHMMERLVANTTMLRSIVESLLDAAKLEHGLTARADPVDLGELTRGAVDRLSPLLQSHDVVLDVGDDTVVRGDRELLERVVDNLLTNAHRHTPAGTRVDVTVARQGPVVELLVRDEGPGIPADVLPRITERFVRAGAHTTRSARGLGIGLALADEILHLHGTALEVTSKEGHGASFACHLPHVTTAPAQTAVTVLPRAAAS